MSRLVVLGSAAASVRRTASAAALALALPVLGAVGFCTRVPIGTGAAAWDALTDSPWALVVAAYPLGAAVALALVPALPPATTAVVLPAWLLVLAGITHLDGLADAGDAAVVHGDVERRREVLLDTDVGVGALVAVGLALLGLGLAALALATAPLAAAAAVVIAAEVGAKLGMATLAGLGPATFGALGSQLEDASAPTALAAGAVAVPAAVGPWLALGPRAGLAATAAVVAGPLAALVVGTWARRRLDGVNGDCFGATNELARLGGLHAGLAVLAADGASGPANLGRESTGVAAQHAFGAGAALDAWSALDARLALDAHLVLDAQTVLAPAAALGVGP